MAIKLGDAGTIDQSGVSIPDTKKNHFFKKDKNNRKLKILSI